MYHLNTIMKKLTLVIILFQFNSTFGQSISDVSKLKKQYEEYKRIQNDIIIDRDNNLIHLHMKYLNLFQVLIEF